MENKQKRYGHLNVATIGIIASFSAQVIHELVHLLVGLLVGFDILGLHLFAVHIHMVKETSRVMDMIWVEASASLVNIIISLVAILIFYRSRHASIKLASMLMAGFHGMMGFGYLMFDGLFYTPGAAGDWKAVLSLVDGNLMLRVSIIVIGAVGFMGLFFWLGKAPLAFIPTKLRDLPKARLTLGLKVLVVPYILSILLNLPLAVLHPLGFPQGFIIVFFQYVFGYSGFITGFFMLWAWLAPKPFLSDVEVVLSEEKAVGLWGIAGMTIVIQLLLAIGIYIV